MKIRYQLNTPDELREMARQPWSASNRESIINVARVWEVNERRRLAGGRRRYPVRLAVELDTAAGTAAVMLLERRHCIAREMAKLDSFIGAKRFCEEMLANPEISDADIDEIEIAACAAEV